MLFVNLIGNLIVYISFCLSVCLSDCIQRVSPKGRLLMTKDDSPPLPLSLLRSHSPPSRKRRRTKSLGAVPRTSSSTSSGCWLPLANECANCIRLTPYR